MSKEIRQLAAIMFADMEGYTAMMQEDEQRAKGLRDRYRKVLDESILEYHGIILQHYGDGTLVMFGSAVDAVRSAERIQRRCTEEPVVPLRIGIHVGDIAYDQDGIYGDSVNVASRIESLSVPGAVLFSGKVHDEIRNRPDLPARNLGKYQLKNVDQPMDIYALATGNLTVPDSSELSSPKASLAHSVAVLPFVNMSTDPENEYFSDGITEELINALVRVKGLRVTSRTSSFAFKGRNEDIREIGRRLNVSTVLEGSVRKAGRRIRVTAQLINTSDGYHVFSEVYDRDLEDIFAVQDEISRRIANLLRERFLAEGQPLVQPRTTNMEAYNLYLKGMHYWNQWSPPAMRQALLLFENALELEPDFALAYSGIASTHLYLGATGQVRPALSYPKARAAAEEALRLDPDLPESHIAIADLRLFEEWNWEGARRSLDRALELSPGSAHAHHSNSLYFIAMGDAAATKRELEIAVELDPLSPSIIQALGYAYLINGEVDRAFQLYWKLLEFDPTYRGAYGALGWASLVKGDVDEAIRHFEKFQSLTSDKTHGRAGLGYAYAMAGRMEDAEECLHLLHEREQREPDVSLDVDFVAMYAGLGDIDRAFDYLEKAVESRLGSLIFLRANPAWSRLHKDPRFNQLLARMGLPLMTAEECERVCICDPADQ
ncbi:MAG: tetratricopeptide repeat protein [Bacteroidetes bacterium]|nr:tetratricopeptide repeat protein [Bacteroidota bacterium]